MLKVSGEPLSCPEIVERARTMGLLESFAPTPQNTLSALLRRDIAENGSRSEFKIAGRGRFELNDRKVSSH